MPEGAGSYHKKAVRDWMPDRIHALAIEARTPDEAARQPKDCTP
jgi:acid stress-induced BolA-like protein IbaG/YrbA